MAVQSQLGDRGIIDTSAFAAAVAEVEENSVTILSPELMLKGEYIQDGDDLIIRGDMGEEIRVEAYFSGDQSPVLQTVAGAILQPETVQKLLVDYSEVDVAGPAGSIAIPGLLGDPIGTIDEMNGNVTAKGADGKVRELQEGDPIYQNDLIETVGRSFANLRMVDDTSFQLGKETRAIIENYSFTPGVESGQFEATVVSGFFRYASGKLGGLDKGTHTTIKTPTAQIGVRGSEMEGVVEEDGSSTFVHRDGILDVSDANGRGTVTLDQPGMATAVSIKPGAPEPVFEAPDELLAVFEEALPPPPEFVVSANEEEAVEELLEVPLGDETASDEGVVEENLQSEQAEVVAQVEQEVEVEEIEIDLQPVAQDDTFSGEEDVELRGSLSDNDTMGDGSHTWVLVEQAKHGTVELLGNGDFVYRPNEGENYYGSDQFSYTLRDAQGDESTAQVTLNLAPVNDAPEVITDGVLIYRSDTGLSGALALNDVDSENLTGATITINDFVAGDLLKFVNQSTESGGITLKSYQSGVLTLEGTGTVAEYEQALKSIVFESDPTATGAKETREITWVVSDGEDNSASQTTTVTIANLSPDVHPEYSGAILYTEGETAETAKSLFSGVTIDPVEPNQGISQIVFKISNVLDVENEYLSIDGLSILLGTSSNSGSATSVSLPTAMESYTLTYNSSTKGAELTLQGLWSKEQASSLINGVKYINDSIAPNDSATREVKLHSVMDNGVPPGEAINQDFSVSSTITVQSVNTIPELTTGSTMSYSESTGLSGSFVISDLDSEYLTSATIKIDDYVSGDQLTFSEIKTATGTIASDYQNGTLTLEGSGTAAEYQAALLTIRFSYDPAANAGKQSRQFSWSVSDGKDSSSAVTTTVSFEAPNVAPTVSVTTAAREIDYVEGQGSSDAALLFDGVVIDPVEQGQKITHITLTVDNVVDFESEWLVVESGFGIQLDKIGTVTDIPTADSAAAKAMSSYEVDYNATTDQSTVTLVGSWTPEEASSLVNGLKYTNSSATPSFSEDRVVSLVSVQDSGEPAGKWTYSGEGVSTKVTVFDAPAVEVVQPTASYLVGQASAVSLGEVQISTQSGKLQSATVTLPVGDTEAILSLDTDSLGEKGFTINDGQLVATSGNTIAFKYESSTHQLQLSGAATEAEYELVMSAIQFSTDATTVATIKPEWRVVDEYGNSNSHDVVKSDLIFAAVDVKDVGVELTQEQYLDFSDSNSTHPLALLGGLSDGADFSVSIKLSSLDTSGTIFSIINGDDDAFKVQLSSDSKLLAYVYDGKTNIETLKTADDKDVVDDLYMDGQLNEILIKMNIAGEGNGEAASDSSAIISVNGVQISEFNFDGSIVKPAETSSTFKIGEDIEGAIFGVTVEDHSDSTKYVWDVTDSSSTGSLSSITSDAGGYELAVKKDGSEESAEIVNAYLVNAYLVNGEVDLSALSGKKVSLLELTDQDSDATQDVVQLSAKDLFNAAGDTLFITSDDTSANSTNPQDKVVVSDEWTKGDSVNGMHLYTSTYTVDGSNHELKLYVDENINFSKIVLDT